MILYENQRFHMGDISFALPDHIYLNTTPSTEYEYGMELVDEEERFVIAIGGEETDMSAQEFLESLGQEDYTWDGEITPVECNGFEGCYLVYSSRRDAYCEYCFKKSDTDEDINALSIVIQTEKEQYDIHEIMKDRAVQELIESIR